MRWNLIDKYEILKKGEYIRAFKNFSGQEDFFAENFPKNPLVPEPLFIEMIAQTSGVLFGFGLDFKKEVILAKIFSAEFFGAIKPPCRLEVEARIDDEREEGAWISGVVSLGGQIAAKASILLVTIDSLREERSKIVFSDDFLKYFDIYNIAKASEGIS